MFDVIAKPFRRLGIVADDFGEDVVKLAHVTLQIRRQRERGAGFGDAAAFADGSSSIVEIVHAEVGDDQIEGGVGKRHCGRASFVQRNVARSTAGDFFRGAFEAATPWIDAVH